uniref:BOP1 N-terminal domain-containing protein n=1 Tax=Schistocephalus solidus TaxID=70667 RepID=A0A0V0J4M9_SCHSO
MMSGVVDRRGRTDEYDFDSSDEEDIRNTVGNVPMHWYDSFPHVGYDSSGRPIMKPGYKSGEQDAISSFLRGTNAENGEEGSEWRTIIDPRTGQSVVLSDRDLEIVTRMSSGKGVLGDKEDEIYQPWDDFFSGDVLQMPVTAHPPQKRSFIPSLLDRRRVGRITHAIKMGWIRPRLPPWALEDSEDMEQLRRYSMYLTTGKPNVLDDEMEEDILGFSSSVLPICTFPDVWADDEEGSTSATETSYAWQAALPASLQTYRPPRPRPFMRPASEPLPSHAESYNPPPEFLLSSEEERAFIRAWRDKVKDNQTSHVMPLLPHRYDCLRHVPFCERYLREREERIKDMVMAARVEKQQVHTTPEALLPEIPSLADLRPYPSHQGLEYRSHSGRVTALSVSPCGQWLASVSPVDGCLRIWETQSNFCFRCYQLVPSSPHVAKPANLGNSAAGLLKRKKTVPASDATKAEVDVREQGDKKEDEDDDDDEVENSQVPSAFVAWNPNHELHLVAAAIGDRIFVINPGLGDRLVVEKSNKLLEDCWRLHLASPVDLDSAEAMQREEGLTTAKRAKIEEESEPRKDFATWSFHSANMDLLRELQTSLSDFSVHWGGTKAPPLAGSLARSKEYELARVTIRLTKPLVDLSWHSRGDYLLSLSMSVLSSGVRSRAPDRLLLHRLSRMTSQAPFVTSSVEDWRMAAFQPNGKPQLVVAGSKQAHILDLVGQKELRRLKLDLPGDRLRCMSLHPTGDHIIAGTSDSRFVWFDVELGNVPFKKLKLNHGTIHKVHVHSCRPLVSVATDDGSLFIIHGKVTDDLLSKPIVIPVQRIRTGYQHAFSTTFHTKLPHVYAGGEDGTVRQFVAWN